jgi:multidrug efflux system outer membrane protein
MFRMLLATSAAIAALSACTLAPSYERPSLPVAANWPGAMSPATSAADLAWTDVILDPKLQSVVRLALTENRDLRIAVLNIEKARAQYRVQRASLIPSVSGTLSGSQGRTPGSLSPNGVAVEAEQASATIGLSAYELDLFGRVRSLSASALQSYFAVAENRRAAQISLIAEVASTYLTLAADQDLLALAQEALKTREATLELTRKRFDAGAASQLDVSQIETLAEQARAEVGAYTALVAQDRNALRLVVGAEPPVALLPTQSVTGVQLVADIPAGLPSDVLIRRPDVLAAEHGLRAKNANIGAARANFFPRITLTGSTGTASVGLDDLFTNGTGVWSFAPQVSLPIFDGGANIANLQVARADRDIAVAQYEKAVQTAFREVADALAVKATVDDRVAAQERLAAAAAESVRLSTARYERGVDSYLAVLDAQRTLFAARQGVIGIRLIEANNRVTLYRVLGGGA